MNIESVDKDSALFSVKLFKGYIKITFDLKDLEFKNIILHNECNIYDYFEWNKECEVIIKDILDLGIKDNLEKLDLIEYYKTYISFKYWIGDLIRYLDITYKGNYHSEYGFLEQNILESLK